MSYTMYTPLNVWLDPASVTDVVAYIQNYLSENTIYSEEEIEELIHDYLIAHPELIGGVQSVNGKTGTVVLSASDINTANNVTIESVLASLSSQISSIASSVATNTANITNLTGRVSTAETDISNLKSNISYVTPEMFGAIGDGITDDTPYINQAIALAKSTGKTLSAVGGKTYAISSQIDLSEVNVDFNKATLKCIQAIQFMIVVDSTNKQTDITHTIQNIIIDCDNVSGAISYTYGLHDQIKNMNIINLHQTGIRVVSGGGVYISDSYIQGDSSATSQGIVFRTSDCRVNTTILKDCHVGIYNEGTNLFDFVHSWMSKNVANSICFHHVSGNVVMFGCHLDTYQKAIYRNTDANLDLIGCLWYINSFLWDSDQTPYIVWSESTAYAYNANIHFTNCSFNPLNTASTLTNIPYNRIVFTNCFFKDGITGNIDNVIMTLNNISASDDDTYVRLRQDEKIIRLDAFVKPTTDLSTGFVGIMSIPSSYMYPANASGTGYTARGHAILFLDAVTASETITVGVSVNPNSGLVSINIPSSLTTSRIKAIEVHFSYAAKKSLDYYRG